ncbi:hypothetical protein [Nocardia sp. NPDC051981]|uniref:hypothetical protein n=1 Tax=Nocardia sp. NPDC051981 TaxID=3155417 RepID=UPI003414142A
MRHDAVSAHPLDNRGALVRALYGTEHSGRCSTERPLLALRLTSDQLTAQAISAELMTAEGKLGGHFWSRYLGGGIASVAVRAASEAVSEDDRRYLLAFLEVWADTVFADRSAALRHGTVEAEEWAVAESAGAAVVVESSFRAPLQFVDLQRGQAGPPTLGRIQKVTQLSLPWGDARQLRTLIALIRDRGPLPHTAAAAQVLAESAGLSTAAARLLFTGQLELVTTYADRKERRAASKAIIGVSVGALDDAWQELADYRASINPLPPMWADALPDDPAELWTEDGIQSTALRFADSWNRCFGRRTAIPEDTIAAAGKARDQLNRRRDRGLSAATLCSAVTDPGAREPVFLKLHWQQMMLTCRWAYAHLPAGDPVHSAVPRTLEALRAHLCQPDLSVYVGTVPVETVAALRARAGTAADATFDNGLLVATERGSQTGWSLEFRPAHYGKDERTAELRAIASREYALLFADLDWMFGPDCDRMIERVATGEVPVGAYEIDPRQGAPELTAQVVAEFGLDEDAAALYLQLATAIQPSDKNIRRWNRWTPARHRKAEAALVESGLVVRDKRGRAGRGTFPPGPWDSIYGCEKWKQEVHRTYGETSTFWETLGHTPEVVLSELFRRGLDAAREASSGTEPATPATVEEPVQPPAPAPTADTPSATDSVTFRPLDDRTAIEYALNGFVEQQWRKASVLYELQVVSNVLRGHHLPDSIDAEELVRSANTWQPLVTGVGSAALRAISPATDHRQRSYLLAFLDVWADTVFADASVDLRVGSTIAPDITLTQDAHGAVLAFPGRRFGNWYIASRYGDGEPPVPGTIETHRPVGPRWGTAVQIRAVVELVRERGPVQWDPAAPAEFARRTGVSRACAILVLAGFIGWSVRTDNLSQDSLSLLNLTPAALDDGAREMLEFARGRRTEEFAVLARALPEDPAEMWHPEGMRELAVRAADAWIAEYGRRTAVSEQAVAEVNEFRITMSKIGYRSPAALLASVLADPDVVPILTSPIAGELTEDSDGHYRVQGGDLYERFRTHWRQLLETCRWAYSHLPAGHEIREGAARTLELVQHQLRTPTMQLHIDMRDNNQRMAALFNLTGRTPVLDELGRRCYDDGFIVGSTGARDWWQAGYRTAHYGEDERTDWLRTSIGQWPWEPTLPYLDWILGPDCDAMIARLRAADLPLGGYEADPRLVVPDLVDDVATAFTLTPDAATLYLQLLTLLDPTDKNIRRWNNWDTTRHRRAQQTLLATGPVTRAKRKGAGRSLFLSDHWMTDPGCEYWKLALHQLPNTAGRQSDVLDMQGARTPRKPLPDLFRTAWQRIVSGDIPG